ncbi:Tetratricopeptide repeat-containing protein [Formosa sp. Hel1_31_208]|jgi:tetratricopeptide (TPR) repeat protein|uniref:tetratricopeptide repeat protein n=1 Tax=Formosa sp. Hel1_31_208 TaxID=1798225 RepID=UPI00087BC6B9|nr:tetratricopeptide repeat protein [Formosa sp. Hel1_31_208]SDS50030.1 Tetratricopeptide repeat-containing protein [Formosa sp. Hel1_31_208]
MINKNALNIFERGLQKSIQGDYFGAIEDFTNVIEINPKYTSAYIKRAQAKISTEEISQILDAYSDYDMAISLDANCAEAIAGRGTLKILLNPEDEDGLIDLEAAAEIDTNYSSYFNIGISKLQLEDYNGVIEAFSKYIQIEKPQDFWIGEAHYFIGLGFHNLNEMEEAVKNYSLAIKNKAQENYHSAFFNRAMCFEQLNLIDKASSDYENLIELKPDFIDAYVNLSKILVYKNLRTEGIVQLKKALKYDENNSNILDELAKQLLYIHDFDSAVNYNSVLINLNPNKFHYYLNRGLCYLQLNKFEESIKDYNKSIELNDNISHAYYYRGLAHLQLGNNQACIDWKIALEKGFTDAKPYLDKYCKSRV